MNTEKKEYLGAAETAKVVRKILKDEFKGVKFSVTSKSYSGGNSVRVSWIDGPTTKRIESAVGVLSGSGFDGMIDLKYNIDHWLSPDGSYQIATSQGSSGSGGCHTGVQNPKPHPNARLVQFADSILPSRDFSKEFLETVIGVVSKKFSGEVPTVKESGFGHYMHCTDYHQERLYWTILQTSEIVDGKLICNDFSYGPIINH